jgi:hypothetical protein
MLLPAITKAKGLARNIQCMNNHRQLILAMNGYLNDYDAVFPSQRMGSTNWGEQMCTYLNLKYDPNKMPEKSFRCPEQRTWTGTFMRIGYAYNGYLFGEADYAPVNGNPFWGYARTPPPPIKMSNITSPSMQLVFIDSWTGNTAPEYRMSGYPFLESPLYMAFRHKHNSNVAYMAGNVKSESYIYLNYSHPAYYPINAACQNKPRYSGYEFIKLTDFSPY